MDDFLISKDKYQSFINHISHIDKNKQYSNLYLNQNQYYPSLISNHSSTKQYNEKICEGISKILISDSLKVFENHERKSPSWNKSLDLCFNTLSVFDKSVKERKKDFKKDISNSTLSLLISAYENIKEVPQLDTLDRENVGLKRNKIDMAKQIFPGLMIQNLFEFPRQQERDHQITEPEIMGFKASQRLLDPNHHPTSSYNAGLSKAAAGSLNKNCKN
uniref:Uncharacterized protein n=1 Tax=Panagrolaimus davidi TaxID=227884 RepID=A0A914QYJ0_9BILA